MSRIYFIVEGETEEYLIKSFYLGTVQVLNLWTLKNEKIKSLLRLIPRSSKVFVVYDTDSIGSVSRNDFISNFHSLKKHVGSTNILLFQQTANLEDELMRCLGIHNRKKLYELFNNASGTQQLKRNFLAEKSLVKKLLDNGFDLSKLWRGELCRELGELREFHSYPSMHDKLILRPKLNT